MFVQVIEGRTGDAAGLRRQFERWQQEVRPGAEGFLGSTVGIADDGNVVALARFESADAAARNSQRAEQAAWWNETEKYLEGATFHDCTDTDTTLGGGRDDAGFVQVMIGRCTDPARMKELNRDFERRAPEVRPDVLGGISVFGDDGYYAEAAYFTSEADARAGEQDMANLSGEDQAMYESWQAVMGGEVRYVDLKDPIII